MSRMSRTLSMITWGAALIVAAYKMLDPARKQMLLDDLARLRQEQQRAERAAKA
jgi:hypothetical protein